MLRDVLYASGRRPQVVDDGVALVAAEVAAKQGLGGMAVKGAFAVVKAVKPGIIHEAVDNLLDDFIDRLDPFYAEYRAQAAADGIEAFFTARADAVANALLGVTDVRAAKAANKTIKKAYEKLRPTGVKHTAAAVPGLARLIAKYG